MSPLTVDNAELSQTVNLYGCKNSTIVIKGKVNAITLGTCYFKSISGSQTQLRFLTFGMPEQ